MALARSLYFIIFFILLGCSAHKPPARLLHLPQDRQEFLAMQPEDPEPVQLPEEFFQPYNPKEYKVSRGDVLEISIYGHGDVLTEEIPVAPDGKLYYYFIDGIQADGRSTEDIQMEIESKIGHLFANPDVSVIPRQVTSSKYNILGKVKGPGSYYISSSLTLTQAVGEAGGLAEGAYRGTSIQVASLRNSFIVRDGKRLPVDFQRLMGEEGADQDIYVRPGDYIYIASALLDEVYRLGAVYEPRAVTYHDGMSLVGLITGYSGESGGYLPSAYINKIVLIRGRLEQPVVTLVDLERVLEGRDHDVYLQPGDIVYVPYKRFKWFRELVHTAFDSYSRSFGGNAGDHFADHDIIDPDD